MTTLSRQYELERRLVRILISALLLSWLAGFFLFNAAIKIWFENSALSQRIHTAEWFANDQRLALAACYAKRPVILNEKFLHETFASLDHEPESE